MRIFPNEVWVILSVAPASNLCSSIYLMILMVFPLYMQTSTTALISHLSLTFWLANTLDKKSTLKTPSKTPTSLEDKTPLSKSAWRTVWASSGQKAVRYCSKMIDALATKYWYCFSRLMIDSHRNLARIGDNLNLWQIVSSAVTTAYSLLFDVCVRILNASSPWM